MPHRASVAVRIRDVIHGRQERVVAAPVFDVGGCDGESSESPSVKTSGKGYYSGSFRDEAAEFNRPLYRLRAAIGKEKHVKALGRLFFEPKGEFDYRIVPEYAS